MLYPAVYSCVRILSEAVVSLWLHVYKYNGGGAKEKAIKHPLYFLLHDEPNSEMTSFVFRETLMTHLLLWGNAYARGIDFCRKYWPWFTERLGKIEQRLRLDKP